MRESDLPSPDIGGKGYHLRRCLAAAISQLEVNATVFGGKHPGATNMKSFLDAATARVAAILPIAGTMTFNPTASSYSIAAGAAQAGPVLNRGAGNDGAVTYTSATPAVATVNQATGAITPLTVGTSVITAAVAAYGGFLASTKTYVATVTA